MTSFRFPRPAAGFAPVLVFAVLVLACQPPEPPPPPPASVPVTSEVVTPAPFRAALTLLGTVRPAATVELKAPAPGRLRYPAGQGGLETGRRVREGEVLFRVESPDLELELREAELKVEAAGRELERIRRGVEGGFTAEAKLDQVEIDHELAGERLAAVRQAIARLEVHAPLAGVLRVEKALVAGVEVAAETLVAELDAAGSRRVEAWATASDLGRLRPGLEAECRAASGDLLGRGKLAELDGRLDAGGVARVVAVIGDDLAMPPPGDGVELHVLLGAKEAVLSVPARSVIVDGSLSSVFVLEAQGQVAVARARLVRTGGRQGDRVEVLDGLEEGERVAVDGAELLADGLQAKDVTEGSNGDAP